MANEKFKDTLLSVLKADERLWQDGEFNQTRLFDLVDKHDAILLKLLLDNTELKAKFFVKVNDIFIFKGQDFKFFLDENKLDNSYTQFENIIGLKVGSKMLKDRDEVVLNFPFKDCVLQGGQSRDEGTDIAYEYNEKLDDYVEMEAKRKEVFFNEILAKDEIDRLEAPKVLKNWKRYTKDGEVAVGNLQRDEDGIIQENLIIKGNNLLALHSIKKEFAGKVKLIYIDPPYNTGSDSFKYNDNFNHSTWLTFMKNRLEVAKELLRNDGSFWISLNDDEVHYCKVLADEVFGRENFISTIIWNSKYTLSNDAKYVSYQHENILFYAKSKIDFKIGGLDRTDKQNNAYKNPDNDSKGPWKATPIHAKSGTDTNIYEITFPNGISWTPPKGRFPAFSKETLLNIYKVGGLYFNKNGGVDKKTYLSEVKNSITPGSVWSYDEVGHTHGNNEELAELVGKGVFDNPKGVDLLKKILKVGNVKGADIILDYHTGSATTGDAVLQINKEDNGNRKFILIEQMDYVNKISLPRLINSMKKEEINDNFVYFELAEWNEEAKLFIQDAKNIEELEVFFESMYERYFLNYNVKAKEFKEKVLGETKFRSLPLERQKDMFIRMLDLNQMYVNYTERNDKKFGLSGDDISFSEGFYKN